MRDHPRGVLPGLLSADFTVLRDRSWVKLAPGSAGADRCRPVNATPKRFARRCRGEGPVDVDVDVDVVVALAVADE